MSERVIEFELAIHHSPSRYTNPAASRASRKFRTEAKSAVWRGAICTKAKTAFQPLASQSFPLLPGYSNCLVPLLGAGPVILTRWEATDHSPWPAKGPPAARYGRSLRPRCALHSTRSLLSARAFFPRVGSREREAGRPQTARPRRKGVAAQGFVNERGAPFHPQSMRCWGGTRLEAYFLRCLRRDGRSAAPSPDHPRRTGQR